MKHANGPVVGVCIECVKKRVAQNGGLELCEKCQKYREKIDRAIETGELLPANLLCPYCIEHNRIGLVRIVGPSEAINGSSPVKMEADCDGCGHTYEVLDGPVPITVR